MTIEVEAGGRRRAVSVRRVGDGWAVTIDGQHFAATLVETGERWSLLVRAGGAGAGGSGAGTGAWRSYEVAFEAAGDGAQIVHVGGAAVLLSVIDPRATFSRHRHEGGPGDGSPASIVAPMPGRVVKVLVAVGDAVAPRQGVVVVEAMKMENELRAPRAGTVREVRVSEGMSVEAKSVLVVID